MTVAMILSSVALGMSVIVSGGKLLDGFVRADPRALMRIGRQSLFFLAVASVPCLVLLLIYEQWAPAMMLAAAMLIVPVFLHRRSLAAAMPFRRPFQPNWTEDAPSETVRGDCGQTPPGPDLARRAAIVLEDYLAHVGNTDAARADGGASRIATAAPMQFEEALSVLGLGPEATEAAIRAAHRRLMQRVHPDLGGSNYLATKINQAKEVLLGAAAARPRAPSRDRMRTTPRRTGRTNGSAGLHE